MSSVFVGPDVEFVNADIIGAELRRDDPDRPGADVTAGRIVLARLRALTAERRSFCFETNLASPGLVGRTTDGVPMGMRCGWSCVAPERRSRTRPSRPPVLPPVATTYRKKLFVAASRPGCATSSRSTAAESTNGRSRTTRPAVPC